MWTPWGARADAARTLQQEIAQPVRAAAEQVAEASAVGLRAFAAVALVATLALMVATVALLKVRDL